MAETSIHLIQSGFLQPVIQKARESHINIDKMLQQTDLDKFYLDESEKYIPVNAVYQFLILLEKEDSIDNFLDFFMPSMQPERMTYLTDELIFKADLYTTCKLATVNDQIIFTHERMELNTDGTRSTFSSYFVDDPLPGRELLELLNLALIINTFRLASGHRWLPYEIHLQHENASYLEAFLPEDQTVKVFTKQNATMLVFHTAILKLPMLGQATQEENIHKIFESPLLMSQKITQLLESNALDYLPNLTYISNLSNISSRTIQRKLKEEGTSYREVLEVWRFKRSLYLLAKANLPIKEISPKLGYSHVSNFERAFRRWTNDTPENYRQSILS